MQEKIIRLTPYSGLPDRIIPANLETPNGTLIDAYQRPLQDLRISVTDRCNFRCVYCMPKEIFDKNHPYLPQSALLSFEEIERIAKIFIAHGVSKIRLTGGEPLLRKNLEFLIEMLAKLKTPDGRELDLSLTTNASLLAKKARSLKDAGLKRVTVSLDALDDRIFKQMNDVDFPVSDVLEGIEAAHQAGLGPVKVNMVVKAGLNEQEIVPMARYFKSTPHSLRFIEYMDVGASNGWKLDQVISSDQILQRLEQSGLMLKAITTGKNSETAKRWRYLDGAGEVGFISSVTQAFCHACTRARLSTEGQLYTCLFASQGHDLRSLLRNTHTDQEISTVLAHLWRSRNDRYSQLRSENTNALNNHRKIEMSYIGG